MPFLCMVEFMEFGINGIKWQVLFIKPNDIRLKRGNGTYTLGVTNGATNTVYINNRLNEYMTIKVLTHEIVHCFCFSYGIILDENTEEILADFLATYGREAIEVADDLLYRIGVARKLIV